MKIVFNSVFVAKIPAGKISKKNLRSKSNTNRNDKEREHTKNYDK